MNLARTRVLSAALAALVLADCAPDFDALVRGDGGGPSSDAPFDSGELDGELRLDVNLDVAAGGDSGILDAGDGRDALVDTSTKLDASPDDACIVTSETCDGVDQDCDSQIDEDVTECDGGMTCRAGACRLPSGTEIWSVALGSTVPPGGFSRDRGRAVGTTASGDVIVVGDVLGEEVSFGDGIAFPNAQDAFVARFSGDGTLASGLLIGGAAFDQGNDVAIRGDAVIVGGTVVGTVALDRSTVGGTNGFGATLSASVVTSATRLAGTSRVLAVAATDTGYVIAGSFDGMLDLGTACSGATNAAGATHLFVARIDADESVVWCRAMGGGTVAVANDIAVDALGNVFVAGTFRGPLVADGTTYSDTSSFDAIFVRLAGATGDVLWSDALRGSGTEEGNAVATGAAGSVYFGGLYSSSGLVLAGLSLPKPADADPYVVRLNTDDSGRWVRTDDETFESRVLDLVAIEDGVVVSGEHGGVSWGTCPRALGTAFDLFVARLDDEGDCQWQRSYGGPEQDRGGYIAVREQRVYLTGSVGDGARVGGIDISTAGDDAMGRDQDILLVALEL